MTVLAFPETLTEDLADILGRPCFACSGLASVLRKSGLKIATKAEAEQAAVLHWMLLRFFRHGDEWRVIAHQEMKAMLSPGDKRRSVNTTFGEHPRRRIVVVNG